MQYSKDHNSKKKKKESKQITWENTFKEPTSMILGGETTHRRNTLLYPNNDIKQTSGLHKAT